MMYCKSCHCERRAKCDSRDCYVGSLDHLNDLHRAGVIRYAGTGAFLRVVKNGLRMVNGRKPRARIDENGTVVILS